MSGRKGQVGWLVVEDERTAQVYFLRADALECVLAEPYDYKHRVVLATKGGGRYFTGTFLTFREAAEAARRVVEALSTGPLGARVRITEDGEVEVEGLHA